VSAGAVPALRALAAWLARAVVVVVVLVVRMRAAVAGAGSVEQDCLRVDRQTRRGGEQGRDHTKHVRQVSQYRPHGKQGPES
jgi:hypothetical protein